MAITPATDSISAKRRAWQQILKSMGYRDLNHLIENIVLSSDTPDTELSSMDDYAFVWDYGNRIAYLHETGTTFTAIGQATKSNGGMTANVNTIPNAEGSGLQR